MREILEIVVKSWKNLLAALILMFLVFIPFGTWGVNIWAGKFDFCNDDSVETKEECVGNYYVSLIDGDDYLIPRYSFFFLFFLFLFSFLKIYHQIKKGLGSSTLLFI